MSVDVKSRTCAPANEGRDGRVRTRDGKLDLQLSTPIKFGGAGGEGTNLPHYGQPDLFGPRARLKCA